MDLKETNKDKIHIFEDLSKSNKIFFIAINIFFALIILFTIDFISGKKIGLIKLTQIIILGSDELDWRAANESYNMNNTNPIEKYISKHPKGKYVRTANDLLESLIWNKTILANSLEAYSFYVKKFPKGKNYDIAIDEIDWFKATSLNAINAYLQYIDKHPNGKYISVASEKIAWANALNANTIDAFYSFCEIHKEGMYYSMAKDSIWSKTKLINSHYYYYQFAQQFKSDYRAIEAMRIIENYIWENAQNVNKLDSYRQYLNDYPNGRYINDARERIESLVWQDVQRENTTESYNRYIKEYPNGRYAVAARARFSSLRQLENEWADILTRINNNSGIERYNHRYPPNSLNGTFTIVTRNKSTISGNFSYNKIIQNRSLRADLVDLVITCSIGGYNERIEFHGRLKDKPCSLRKRCGPVVFELNECSPPSVFRILQYDWPETFKINTNYP